MDYRLRLPCLQVRETIVSRYQVLVIGCFVESVNALCPNSVLALSGATAVWEAAIQSDMQLWKSLAQQSSMSVSGIPDNVLTQCGETVFVGVCVDLATNAKMESVGFLTNPSMRQRVGQTLGLDENLEKLLVYSAQVACNYS